jgi:glucose/arabinose dehydrogenase
VRKLSAGLAIAVVTGAVAFAGGSVGATNINAPIKLKKITAGLDNPVALAWRSTSGGNGGVGPAFIYVAQQTGSVVLVKDGNILGTVLKLDGISVGGEQGLLGIVFSNDGTKLYVDYTDASGNIQIVEYRMSGTIADTTTRRPLLTIPHSTYPNHNGGDLVMGSGGRLYISVGDGGGGGDTLHNGQNKNSLLAKILRIIPNKTGSKPYGIPRDNPFVGQANTRAETWMWGLRNPWRFSFDKATNDIWIGDVGQDKYEEIDYAKAGEKGINWGWPLREGFHQYDGAKPPGARDPILERPHTAGDCAIIGGYVYRGKAIKGFQGTYVFGDECTGKLRAVVQSDGRVVQRRDLRLNVSQLSSFGQGPGGEIYATSLHGELYRLDPR